MIMNLIFQGYIVCKVTKHFVFDMTVWGILRCMELEWQAEERQGGAVMEGLVYEMMLRDETVARVNMSNGEVSLVRMELLPLDFTVKSGDSFEDRLFNIAAFRDWCASRVLMMGQKHAKKICNALAVSQENSTENRYRLALAYHCSNLMDAYWVRKEGSPLAYGDVSLFRNTSRNVLTPVSLKGKVSSVFTRKLKNWSDIGADGTLAKSWVRMENDGESGYFLYKESDNAAGEVLASEVLGMLGADAVVYHSVCEDGVTYSRCRCFTTERQSFVPYHVYAAHYKADAMNRIRRQFPHEYANLAVAAYLTGNEDLHDKNWGLLRDNVTGRITGFAPYFDFDGCFLGYIASKDLYFLPECRFVLEDGSAVAVLNSDMDFDTEYEVEGISIEAAALKYAPDCTFDFSGIELDKIPEKYRTEFARRMGLVVERLAPERMLDSPEAVQDEMEL